MRPVTRGPVNLDAIGAEHAGEITLAGVVHQVRQMDGTGYELHQAVQDGTFNILDGYAQVAKLVPTLSAEQVKALNGEQIAAILQIAGGMIELVEQLYPNAVRPAEPSDSPPA